MCTSAVLHTRFRCAVCSSLGRLGAWHKRVVAAASNAFGPDGGVSTAPDRPELLENEKRDELKSEPVVRLPVAKLFRLHALALRRLVVVYNGRVGLGQTTGAAGFEGEKRWSLFCVCTSESSSTCIDALAAAEAAVGKMALGGE